MLSCVVLFVFMKTIGTHANQHEVNSPAGAINGYEYDSVLYANKTAFKFLGIPYAEPPIGNLRFAKPRPIGKLTGTFNASEYGYSCIQNRNQLADILAPFIIPNENCLTLNVFVPADALQVDKKAVMVFIYGGSFVSGATTISGGEHLALFGDVIVVTMNYRVGPLGFMDTGVDEAPGNVGLWDQQLALQWVNKNIESFGGLKDAVTIFGESAGSASVTYQMMFSGNKGLFRRAIAESGSLAARWASTHANVSRNMAKQLAAKVKCDSDSPRSRLDCMRKVDAMKIHTSGSELTQDGTLVFVPVRDDQFIKFDPDRCRDQTSECASNMLDIDFMTGVNDFDGLVGSVLFGPSWKTEGVTEDVFQNQILVYLLPRLEENIVELVKYRYTNHANSGNIARLYQASNLITDLFFTYPSFILSDIGAVLNRRTFVYRYGHKWPLSANGPNIPGAGHAEELNYVFGPHKELYGLLNIPLTEISESEMRYSKTIMTYWTNFAKTGNPNEPETDFRPSLWPEYNNKTKEFLDFGRTYDDIVSGSHMYADRMAFWRDLIPAIQNAMPEKRTCPVSSVDSFTPNFLSVVSLVITTLTLMYV